MVEYQLTASDDVVIRTEDMASIPNDPANADWIEYQAWLADGGVPDPYKKPTQPADAATIVDQSYRAGLVRQADKLQAKGNSYDAIKLLFKATG